MPFRDAIRRDADDIAYKDVFTASLERHLPNLPYKSQSGRFLAGTVVEYGIPVSGTL